MLGSEATLKSVCLPDSFETWFVLSSGETSFVLSETVVILGLAWLCAFFKAAFFREAVICANSALLGSCFLRCCSYISSLPTLTFFFC